MTARILIAQAKHETNTFSRLPTDLEAYVRRMLRYGDDIAPAVRGSNSDGVWNEEGASVIVNITPPPWRTWWGPPRTGPTAASSCTS